MRTSRDWSVLIINHKNTAGKAGLWIHCYRRIRQLCLKLSCSFLVSGNAECFGVIQWNMYQLFYKGWQVCEHILTTPATVLARMKTKHSLTCWYWSRFVTGEWDGSILGVLPLEWHHTLIWAEVTNCCVRHRQMVLCLGHWIAQVAFDSETRTQNLPAHKCQGR